MNALKIVREGQTIGVIPFYDKETMLSDLRSEIIEDFALKYDFRFLHNCMPLDVLLETNTKLKTIIDECTGHCLVRISQFSSPKSSHSAQTKRSRSESTSLNKASTSSTGEPQREEQTTTTTGSFLRSPTSWEVRGVKIYSKEEIASAHGYERKRREFWNELSKKMCKETTKSRAVIAKEVNKAWRDSQADLLLQDEELLKKLNSHVSIPVGKKMKTGTLSKNAERVRRNKTVLEATTKEIESAKLLEESSPRKRKLEALEDKKKFYLSDMRKAQDSMRKNLNFKLSSVRKMCDDM